MLLIATIASNWSMRMMPGARRKRLPEATLGPGSMPMILTRRKTAPRRPSAATPESTSDAAPKFTLGAAPGAGCPGAGGPAMNVRPLPEAPGAVPILGHAVQLWRRPLPFLRELTGSGEVVALRLGPRRGYLACGAAAVSQVLHQPRVFDKGGPLFERARLIVGDGLVSSDFTTHRRQRRLVQPAFAAECLTGYAHLMRAQIEAELASWRANQPLDVGRAMHTLALRVAARTVFGTRLDEAVIADVVAALPVIMRGVYQRMLIPGEWVHRLPLPANRRFEQARLTMARIISDTIRARRRSDRDQGGVLSILVGQDAATGLRDEEIEDQVMTLLIGGTEPPGDAMTWVLRLLADHPDVERALQAESRRRPGRRPGRPRSPARTRLRAARRPGSAAAVSARVAAVPSGDAGHRTRRVPGAARLDGAVQPVPASP